MQNPDKIKGWKILLLFFLVSLVHLYPIIPRFFSALPYPQIGDVNLTLGILYSDVNRLAALDFRGIYHLPFIFPCSYGLTMGFTMLGQALLLLPFHLLGVHNIYLVYNAFVFLCYMLSGYAAYLFFQELNRSQKVSLVAASLYILLPFRIHNVPHLNLLCQFTIPLCFYYLFRILREYRVRDLILFNICLFMQFLFDLSHGFYLAVALAFFCIIFTAVSGKFPVRKNAILLLSLVPTVLSIVLIHSPFLNTRLSLSAEKGGFNVNQYNLSSAFYSSKSYILSLVHAPNKGSDYPGFLVSLLFMFAFRPCLQRKIEKALYWTALLCLLLPALLLILFTSPAYSPALETITDAQLALFILSLALLLVLMKDRLETGLKVTSWAYISLVIISFWPFSRFFNFFDLLAKFLPFLSRSRGNIRTMYIVALLGLAVFAFGLRHFTAVRKRKPLITVLLLLLLFGEQLRWPVYVDKAAEPGRLALGFYREIGRMPVQSGVLELPALLEALNTYTLFTRFHNKHTYHGYYYFYQDMLGLNSRQELNYEKGFPGLRDEHFIQFLNENRLRIILINRVFVPEEMVWLAIKQNVNAGQQLGLYERVEKNSGAFLLVTRDRMTGTECGARLPFYFFPGKKRLLFRLETEPGCACRITFNSQPVTAVFHNDTGQFCVDLQNLKLNPQINDLRFKADRPIILENIHLE